MTIKNARQAFANRFHLALSESGLDLLKQKELGKFFEVSGQAVRKWLNAEAMPNSSRAAQIAEKLQVRRVWLIDGELPIREVSTSLEEVPPGYAKEFSLSAQELSMIGDYRKLPAQIQENISKLLMSIVEKSKRSQ